jgi:hypothetical protein
MDGVKGMAQQLFYEDVKEGMEISQREVVCDIVSQVKWAGVNKDYSRYHYDKEYAVGIKLPNAIVNGRFKLGQITQMLADWGGSGLRKVTLQYRGMDIVGDTMTCRGIVRKCIKRDHEHLVECEVWTESAKKGEKTVVGTAVISLPSRSR